MGTKTGDTSEGALGGLDVLRLAVQVQGVLSGEVTRAGCGGQGTERALRQGDRERGVGRKVKSSITLAPVS
jgi:hypothetical protein